MSPIRNPFRMRASEKIENDMTFLRLFSPVVLEALKDKFERGRLWDNILIIHSSPGGGKTSLLRLFTSSSLKTLYNHRTDNYYKNLFNSLKSIETFDDNGIKNIGIIISCAKNYAILDDLQLDPLIKQKLFFLLLNIRIIIKTIREIIYLNNLKFPESLSQIIYRSENTSKTLDGMPSECNGKELYDWAVTIEEKIYTYIYNINQDINLPFYNINELIFLDVLKPEYFSIQNIRFDKKFIFMFDDTHKLAESQRSKLKELIIENRKFSNVWISERLVALKQEELLPLGAYIGRDYESINIEEYWDKNYGKFENILNDISEKRVKLAGDIQVNSFRDCLVDSIDESFYEQELRNLNKILINKLEKYSNITEKYNNWIDYGRNYNGSLLEQAINLQQIEIIIERTRNKDQLSFEFPLPISNLNDKENSSIKSTAEFFISKKYGLPYYYGLTNLTKLSTQNIEQFLSFSADLFEEIITKYITKKDLILSAANQERIIKKVVNEKWKELSKIVPFGVQVKKFLNIFGKIAEEETDKINAPYAPGVTGIGIKTNDNFMQLYDERWINQQEYKDLLNVLTSCIAFNLLKVNKDVSQGNKGDKWMVFYLNRWLCVHFGLPLHYGGWRPKKPSDLIKWIK